MQVVELRIDNFRGVRVGRVLFDRHTILVGPNNCGKTTIIEALALLFGRDRMVRPLTEHDFYGSDPQPVDRIQLVATITGFAGNDPAQHTDWFRDDRAVPKWWNPGNGTISAVRINANSLLACQIGFCARFNREELDVETLRYFHDDDAVGDVFVDEAMVAVPSRLIRELGFFLVPASRTWDKIVSFGSELFRRVVAAAGGQPAASVLTERDRLRAPELPLENDAGLQPIVTELNSELSRFFYPAPTLRLRLTSTDSDGLLEAVVPHYASGNAPGALPARRHGSGLVSLQHLLLLLQFGRRRAQANEGFWMALEEPELHVPPPLQRRLVHRIQALSTQTFVTTHAPMLAAIGDPRSVVVLRNHQGALTATPLQTAAVQQAAQNSVRKLFQLNRADTIAALMHEVVLVPEGRYDQELLKLLVHAVDLNHGWTEAGESHFGTRVGVIPTHDGAVVATVAALSPLHPRLVAIVDGDAEGQGYAALLVNAQLPPKVTVRWPDNWMIEDVVGWLLNAEPVGALASLDALAPPPATIAELVARLKSRDRPTGGLKQDQVAYEVVAGAIGTIPACRERARIMLNDLSDVAIGVANPRFVAAPGASPHILIFQP